MKTMCFDIPKDHRLLENAKMAMHVPAQWIARARFILGVLLVWGTFSLIWGFIGIFFHGDPHSSRLSQKQLCTIFDFKNPSGIFAPTSCYVYDHSYQIEPTKLKSEDHLRNAEVDLNTLVMVDGDSSASSITKGENGTIDIDGRLVLVYFISGPLSGRWGMISRYKLAIRGFPTP